MRTKLLFMMLSLLFIVVCFPVSAQQKQKFSVATFELDPFDTSARNAAYEKVDGSGSRYAIIKVSSSNPDDNLREYNFNFGNLRSIVEEHDGVLWVYVQKNAKMVTISRKGYNTISRYDLNTTIEAGRNYIMMLSVTAPVVYTQMTRFDVKPLGVGAVVLVKSSAPGSAETMFGSVDETGSVAKSLELGTYTYRVVTDNYHSSEGRITLKDKSKTYVETVTLRPNFAKITLLADKDAEIFVNGERKGLGKWTGILKSGNYTVECRKANHRSSSQYITVTDNDNQSITLASPTPIVGTLAVTSTPLGAKIEIDGKNYGVTPRNISDIIIGAHKVTLSKTNYKATMQEVTVKENQTSTVDAQLSGIAKMTISSQPSGAELFVDGKLKGKTPYSAEMASGDYDVKITYPKYRVFEKRVHFDSSTPNISYSLSRQYQQRSGIYLQASGQAGMMMGVGGNIGGYISNINIEAFATIGLVKDAVYINYTDGSNPRNEDLKPMALGGKVGYGLIFGTRLRVTPQVGAAYLSVKGDIISTNAICAMAGARVEYAFGSHFGVSVTPEGRFAVSKHQTFKDLEQVSSKVKGWGTGADLRLGVYVNF